MHDTERTARLDQFIRDQAGWMSDLAKFQQRPEVYHDGKLPADDAKIEKTAQGQAQYLAAARNITDAILRTVKSSDAQEVEIDPFLDDLTGHQISLLDRAGWRATGLGSENWRRTAAEIARNGTFTMSRNRADTLKNEIVLALVDLLNRHGFNQAERRDVLSGVMC